MEVLLDLGNFEAKEFKVSGCKWNDNKILHKTFTFPNGYLTYFQSRRNF